MPTRIFAGIDYHPSIFKKKFMIPIDCKITKILTLVFFYFFENIIANGWFIYTYRFKIENELPVHALKINLWKTYKPVYFVLSYVLLLTQ